MDPTEKNLIMRIIILKYMINRKDNLLEWMVNNRREI